MCFSDDHTAGATHLGEQVFESSSLLCCFLLGLDLSWPGGLFQGDPGGYQLNRQMRVCWIVHFLFAPPLTTRTTAGWVKSAVTGLYQWWTVFDVLAVIAAVETLLLGDARTLRIISGPLPPALLPLPFHWNSSRPPSKVPESKKMQHIQIILKLNRRIDLLHYCEGCVLHAQMLYLWRKVWGLEQADGSPSATNWSVCFASFLTNLFWTSCTCVKSFLTKQSSI